ncbi:podocan-like [Pristis pectinata]|uniref:podocan-like n=1 Tax=Pristis pectinata TaxID=685728 RepID=UPI00223DBD4A|nr:podocan-like [Pristis pectinata]
MDLSVVPLVFGKVPRMLPWGSLLLIYVMTTPPTSPAPGNEEDEPPMFLRDEVTSCPSRCTCTLEATVDCSGVDLSLFPSNLSANTQHLSLQNNQLENIPTEHLAKLTKLKTLSLHNNRLLSRGLPDKAFKFLQELEYLYLSNNKLTVTPRRLPNTLQITDFAANRLKEVSELTFSHKPRLRFIYLHNNKLTNSGLPKAMFNGSQMVTTLILSSNNLRQVPENLPPLLTQLHLQNNKITKIPKGAFSNLQQLRELYLQSNHLTNAGITAQTFSKMKGMEYLDLSSNNLVKIPDGLPPNIVILQLGKNRITSISKSSVNRIRNLEYLLLQNNRITSAGIHKAAFAKLKKLHTLHLFNNPLSKVPDSLPRRVNSLMLLHDGIEQIGANDFVTTYHLTDLNLSYNKLYSARIHRLAFRKLHQLKRIELSGNRLTLLPSGLPPSLEVLVVQHGQINQLSAGVLRNMKALEELRLNHNKLTIGKIEPGTWGEVPNLKLLDLGYNELSYVPPDLPESLEYVYLQNNRISTITSNSFASAPNVKVIVLRSNRLTAAGLERKAFMGLQHLQVLDLTGNLEHISVLHSISGDPAQAGSNSTAASQRTTRNQLSRGMQRLSTAG